MIDVHAIYQQELAQSGGDEHQALMGTRCRVHEQLQQEAGAPPHFAETKGVQICPGHVGVAPSSTKQQFAAQTAHYEDLWSLADAMLRTTAPHPKGLDPHVMGSSGNSPAELGGVASMRRGGN